MLLRLSSFFGIVAKERFEFLKNSNTHHVTSTNLKHDKRLIFLKRTQVWLTCCSWTCTVSRRRWAGSWTGPSRRWGWRRSSQSLTPHGQVDDWKHCDCSLIPPTLFWTYIVVSINTGMQFQYEAHHRTQVPLLRFDEELIETLEDNQVQLQNLMSSKHIGHFLDEVSTWQSKLSVADSVITIWFEVQRTWMHLENIFIGSKDIRSQMPEVTALTQPVTLTLHYNKDEKACGF